MKVGFIGDAITVIRPDGTIYRYPALHLLSDMPLAWCAAAPSGSVDVYAGVVELDALQAQTLLQRAQAAGVRLALVLDVDGASGAQPLSVQENARLASWMAEKGLPAPGTLEGQIDYVERLQKLLNPVHTMDRVLGAVELELTRMLK